MPPPQTPSSDQSLLPFYTPTPSETPEQPAALDVPETPLPSATPFSYEVKAGDTLSGIALKFGVSLDDLAAENPDVSPNSMSIGTTLRIPSGRANPSSAGTPTPVPVPVKQVECYPSADQGLGCFVLVFNDSDASLENLSAQVSLLDTGGTSVANAIAILPLNILPPGSALPLVVFFPPVIPADTRPLVQLQTGIRLLPDDARYLPATISNTLVQVEGSGRIAQVNGSVYLPDGARQTWSGWQRSPMTDPGA